MACAKQKVEVVYIETCQNLAVIHRWANIHPIFFICLWRAPVLNYPLVFQCKWQESSFSHPGKPTAGTQKSPMWKGKKSSNQTFMAFRVYCISRGLVINSWSLVSSVKRMVLPWRCPNAPCFGAQVEADDHDDIGWQNAGMDGLRLY